MDYNSAIKKNKIMPFVATWMEIRKKDKYNIISSTCGILKKKKGPMNLQTEIDSQT